MKQNSWLYALIFTSAAIAAPALAQRPMGVPPAIPAIETHLQQQRTMEQREAMEAKPAEATEKPAAKPAAPKKKSAKKKRAKTAA